MLVNDDKRTSFAAQRIADLFGGQRFASLTQPLGNSEDFADILAEVPGTIINLDASPDGGSAETNHSPRAVFDDDVLADGAALYAHLAIERLNELSGTVLTA